MSDLTLHLDKQKAALAIELAALGFCVAVCVIALSQ